MVALVLGVGVAVAAARLWPAQSCPPAAEHPEWSVARRWDEAMLGAIRRTVPKPTVHARNLYHVSAAMWDAWAAYDPTAAGVFVTEKHPAPDLGEARGEAMSYAAYRVLVARYGDAVGGEESLAAFAAVMDTLCYSIDETTTRGAAPAALGNRIAETILATTVDDGSNEANGYAPVDYQPVNDPLIVSSSEITMIDPDHWQPLLIDGAEGPQEVVGPHWGHVTPFAISAGEVDGLPIDLGPPPLFGSDEYREQAVQLIRLSSQLDPADPATIDISPAAIGDSALGSDDGDGHGVNPATGDAYEPIVVPLGDFGRVMAEFWADGPNSETPPGHWNVIANRVGDELGQDLRIGGNGPAVERLEWDIKLYLALNGAVHDAAIAAWGQKGHYDSVRPISMIRYMGSLGQSSDPEAPSYNADGLPLVEGLIEIVTPATTAAGARHEDLAGHEGEIAIRAWAGGPADPRNDVGGVTWIRAAEWIPYQLPSFVTPAFPGYVSGHSTFSRAAAEVLTRMTGSAFFPGGESGFTIEPGWLKFESGPSTPIELTWATYYDASDQAGQSRLWGGIHIVADDYNGRHTGAACGQAAWTRAAALFEGAASP